MPFSFIILSGQEMREQIPWLFAVCARPGIAGHFKRPEEYKAPVRGFR